MKIYNKTKSIGISDLVALKNEHYNLIVNDDNSVDINIFDEISDWWGFGVRELNWDIPSKESNLNVFIHSGGGSVTEGLGVANLLKLHKGQVDTIGVGFVASIATAILLAGDNVSMASNGYFMIHKPWSYMAGESDDLRQTADLLDKMESDLADIYVTAIQKNRKLINGSTEETKAQVMSWMAAETWFTAKEAFGHGFIDEVAEDIEVFNSTNAAAYQNQIKNFERTPVSLQNSISLHIKNKVMSQDKEKKVGFLQALKNFVSGYEDVEDIEDTQEAEAVDNTDISDAEELLKLLKAAGYTISESDYGSDDGDSVSDESDEVQNLRLENQRLKAKINEGRGAPSGGSDSESTWKVVNKGRKKAFDKFAVTMKDRAKQG